MVNARTPESGAALASDLRSAIFVQADVTEQQDVARLVDAATKQWGRLDTVVNCAGYSRVVPFDDLAAADDELWERCLQTNVKSLWHVARAATPALRNSPVASIVNVTSIAGIRPVGSSIPYAVSKAAANHLTRLLARTLAPTIRVNAIAPGFIDTPLTAEMPAQFRDRYVASAALGRTGEPEDIAQAALFLATSPYTTGEIVVVDGGVCLA